MIDHKIKLLYATGDSYGFGQGLKAHDPTPGNFYKFNEGLRHTVYTGIIADKWEIPNYINTSRGGCSNDRLLRKIMYDLPHQLEKYKPEEIFVNISYTHTARTEFYSSEAKRHYPLISNWDPKNPYWKSHNELWKVYVAYFDDVKEHVDRHFMNVINMQKFLESIGVRYIINRSMTEHAEFYEEVARDKYRDGLKSLVNTRTFPDDLKPWSQYITHQGLKFTACRHPDEEGHQAIAEYLMNYLIEKKFV